jgi:hypothetical protein
MVVIALTSAKGSPGATAAALALTLTWPGRAVLAECDPAGGSIQAGYLAGALPADRGLRELAVAELRGEDLRDHWWGQLIDLHPPHRHRLLLPGITDPAQSGTLRPVWDRLAAFFTDLERTDGYDVIVDCGRLATPNPPWPVLLGADVVLLALRPTLPDMFAAVPTVRALRRQLAEQGAGLGSLGLLLTGGGDQPGRTVARELATTLVAELPDDPRTVRVLSHGGTVRTNAPLMRAAAGAHSRIAAQVTTRRDALRPDPAASS